MIARLLCLKRNSRSRFQSFFSSFLRLCPRWGLFALFALVVCGCEEQILHDLGEAEANRVVSRLSAVQLGARKVQQSDGRWAIAVPEDYIIAALGFLESNRVLASKSQAGAGAAKSGIVPSRQEQWFRYERAMAQAIEDSLGALGGVLEARVHLNLPESDPLFGAKKREGGSGSVLLLVDGGYSAANEEVAALVAGAAGIPPASVMVLKSMAPQGSSQPGSAGDADVERQGDQELGPGDSGLEGAASVVSSRLNAEGLAFNLLAVCFGVGAVLGVQAFRRRSESPIRFRRLDRMDSEE